MDEPLWDIKHSYEQKKTGTPESKASAAKKKK